MKINKTIFDNTIMGLCAAGSLCAIGSTIKNSVEQDKKVITNISQEIKEKDPNRYLKITGNIASGKFKNQPQNWQKELELMNDSLKIDSLCKKAYFDGAQMVRDSIKNASKVIK